jgi:hypothetical protein
MFFWIFIAHMALPLGEAGIREIGNEEPLLAAMKSTLQSPGMYIFPNMAAGSDQTANEKKIATGPSGLLIDFPARNFQFGKSLVIEFVTELVLVTVGIYLLTLTRISTFAGGWASLPCSGCAWQRPPAPRTGTGTAFRPPIRSPTALRAGWANFVRA